MTEKEDIFDVIAKTVAGQKNYSIDLNCYNYKQCPDQHMGKVQNKNWKRKNIFNENGEVILKKFPSGEGAMIVILESPHTEEYDINGIPQGPACGTTGKNLRKMSELIIFQNYKNYQLYIINAIPFQCSLGDKKMTCRDRVFTATWKKREIGKKYFTERLDNLVETLSSKYDTIIFVNACTVRNNRKKNVQEVIDHIKKHREIKSFETEHPANWNIPELIEN